MVEDTVHRTVNSMTNQYSTLILQAKSNQNNVSNPTISRIVEEKDEDMEGKFYYYEDDPSKGYGKCNRAKRLNPQLCDKRIYQINCPETCFVPTLTPSVPPSSAPTSCRDRKKSFETDDDHPFVLLQIIKSIVPWHAAYANH